MCLTCIRGTNDKCSFYSSPERPPARLSACLLYLTRVLLNAHIVSTHSYSEKLKNTTTEHWNEHAGSKTARTPYAHVDWYRLVYHTPTEGSHLLTPARDRNWPRYIMQIRRDLYTLESTRIDLQNGFGRIDRGELPISGRGLLMSTMPKQ